ncbi:MAG TPA: 50S ribosomal protein L29 [Planctomycetes bacterium]|nr:50S ribosomal protein L29 [Planctomycetota bacterium]
MKAAEVRAESTEHLKVLLEEKRKSLLTWRMRSAAGEGLSPHEARQTRRDIARILTVLKERSRNEAASGGSEGKE